MNNSSTSNEKPPAKLIEGEDFYWESGLLVFTAAYHLKRGYCCASGCRHCPYPITETLNQVYAETESEMDEVAKKLQAVSLPVEGW
jgi:hypothetical protein